jgi:hypothetical protein
VTDPRYQPKELRRLRTIGDPPTDQLIDRLFADRPVRDLEALLLALARAHDVESVDALKGGIRKAYEDPATQAALTPDLEQWLDDQVAALPAQDPSHGQAFRLFEEQGPLIALLLSTASLISSYAAPVGARTLRLSYRLNHDVKRRVGETGQFVLAIMDPAGLLVAHGKAVPSILKVRLMHAVIRSLVERHIQTRHGKTFGQWVYDQGLTEQTDEVPLPQEDQLGSLMAFSLVVLEGLDRLGTKLSKKQQEAYLCHWCAVGTLLGVQAPLLPNNLGEARQARDAIWIDRARPGNEHGVKLTRSLLEMFRGESPDWFDGIVTSAARVAVGPQLADQMEMPRDAFWDSVLAIRGLLGRVIHVGAALFGRLIGDPLQFAARRLLMVPLARSKDYTPRAFAVSDRDPLMKTWGDRRLLREHDSLVSALVAYHRKEVEVREAGRKTKANVHGGIIRTGENLARLRRMVPFLNRRAPAPPTKT